MDNQQRKVTVTEVAWLAGFVDGEGTITLSDRRYMNKRISPHFMLCNTHFPSLDRAVDIMNRAGISVHVNQKSGANGHQRASGVIEASGFGRAKRVLDLLAPYLVTKSEQARIVLDFIERRQKQARLEPVAAQDLDALRQVRILNNRNWTTLTDYTRDSGLEARNCKHCGQAFQPLQIGQIYCSVKCRRAKYLDYGPERACPRCGVVFKPLTRPQQIYCTERCTRNAAQARHRAKARLVMV